MLKTINGSGRYMMVNGGFPSTTYINPNHGAMNVGDLRYNTSRQHFEVYDGNSWIQLSESHASVGLTPDAESAIDWAKKKMFEEAELDRLAQSNPTIADLVEQKKNIDHKIKMVQTLIKEEVKVGTN